MFLHIHGSSDVEIDSYRIVARLQKLIPPNNDTNNTTTNSTLTKTKNSAYYCTTKNTSKYSDENCRDGSNLDNNCSSGGGGGGSSNNNNYNSNTIISSSSSMELSNEKTNSNNDNNTTCHGSGGMTLGGVNFDHPTRSPAIRNALVDVVRKRPRKDIVLYRCCGQNPVVITHALYGCERLELLQCHMQTTVLYVLGMELRYAKTIKILRLVELLWTPETAVALGIGLRYNTSLELLDLQKCHGLKNIKAVSSLAIGIQEHANLKVLNLNYCRLNDVHVSMIVQAILSIGGTLQELYIRGNSIQSKTMTSLAELLSSQGTTTSSNTNTSTTSLKILDISCPHQFGFSIDDSQDIPIQPPPEPQQQATVTNAQQIDNSNNAAPVGSAINSTNSTLPLSTITAATNIATAALNPAIDTTTTATSTLPLPQVRTDPNLFPFQQQPASDVFTLFTITLHNNSSLTFLDLTETCLRDRHASLLAKVLQYNTTLQQVILHRPGGAHGKQKNRISHLGWSDLSNAITKYNTTLSRFQYAPDHRFDIIQLQDHIQYMIDLNRAGRGLVRTNNNVPLSIWPHVLSRMNALQFWESPYGSPILARSDMWGCYKVVLLKEDEMLQKRATVLYYLLRQGPVLFAAAAAAAAASSTVSS